VCSNDAVGSSGPAASISLGGGCGGAAEAAAAAVASVPRLNLAALQQGQGAADDTEISFVVALGRQPDSLCDGELPTARFAPVGGPAAAPRQQEEEEENGMAEQQQHQRHGPPSPITFCLPGDSAPQAARQPAAADGFPSAFSFGMGGAALPAATASLEQQVEAGPGAAAAEAAPGQPLVGVDVEAAAGDDVASRPDMHRIGSGETVQQPLPQQHASPQHQMQPNPFTAMLVHLRGPQYASPARFMHQQHPDSPQSPQQCTPMHLISTSEGTAGQGLASSGVR
jgi:hypothetical protein